MARRDEEEDEKLETEALPESEELAELPGVESSEEDFGPEYDLSEEIAQESSALMPTPEAQIGQSFVSDSPRAPSSFDRYRQMMEQYKRLQDHQNDSMLLGGLMTAGAQIGQSIAGKHSGNFKPDLTGIEAMKEIGAQPAKDFAQRQLVEAKEIGLNDELQARDPNSRMSQAYRMYAKAKMGLNDLPEDASAFDIAQLIKNMGKPGNASPQFQQFNYVDPKTKEIKMGTFDVRSGMRFDATGQQMQDGTRAFANQFRTLPNGDVVSLQPGLKSGAPEVAVGSEYKPVTNMSNKEVDSFQPKKEQREALQKEQDRLAGHTKIARSQFSSIGKLREVLKSNNQLSSAVVQTQMPRLSGEVGNLNAQEQAVWTGSQALMDRIMQWLTLKSNSTITEKNKGELMKLVDIYEKSVKDTVSQTKADSTNHLEKTFAIPRKFSDSTLAIPKVSRHIVKKGYNKAKNQTQVIYDDGTKEILDGQQ